MGTTAQSVQHAISLGRALVDSIIEQALTEISATGLSQVHNACERILARIDAAIPGAVADYRARAASAAESAVNDRHE